jgi:hypothetical protein
MMTLMLSVPSSSPQTYTKRPTGRRTDWLILLLLGSSSRLSNLERTLSTSSLIVGGPGGNGSMVGLLLSMGLLLRRFNHRILALPLVVTHDASTDGMRDVTVFLWDRPTGWRLALGGECGTSWRMVAQGRREVTA